jgi:hypothetical protein
MDFRTLSFRAARWAAAAAFLATAACNSAGQYDTGRAYPPPMPVDADPCAAYCLVWVPPVYRDVPRVVGCKPGCLECDTVRKTKVVFEEVCTCGRCEEKTVPDRCRKTEVVQVTPPKDLWLPAQCPPAPGCQAKPDYPGTCGRPSCTGAPVLDGQCWQRVTVPGDVRTCEKCETEAGFTYCVQHPPKFDITTSRVCVEEPRSRYVPGEYRVVWEKECFQPGHYAWQRRYDCAPAAMPPLRSTCSPLGNRGDFRTCPSAD